MSSTDFLSFAPGSVAVVTGAASGIGRAVAQMLLREGVAVSAWDVSSPGLDDLAEAHRSAALHTARLDITDCDAVAEALNRANGELGAIGLLVNNAGPPSSTPFDFNTGIAASLGAMRTVVTQWLATGGAEHGALVNVASVSGALIGAAPTEWYAAAKAGIAGYTRHLALTRPHGIRANAVAPGIVATPRTAELLATPAGRGVIDRNPMGRAGEPADIAAAIVFLLAPASAYVNGVLLPIDGGSLVTQ